MEGPCVLSALYVHKVVIEYAAYIRDHAGCCEKNLSAPNSGPQRLEARINCANGGVPEGAPFQIGDSIQSFSAAC